MFSVPYFVYFQTQSENAAADSNGARRRGGFTDGRTLCCSPLPFISFQSYNRVYITFSGTEYGATCAHAVPCRFLYPPSEARQGKGEGA
jgi:hypothetical protein